jgi:ATP-dependent RNA helicase DHX8/PRP22
MYKGAINRPRKKLNFRMEDLFRMLQFLSMKGRVRSVLETEWGVADGPGGEISDLILGILDQSSSLYEFERKISDVGIDPRKTPVSSLYAAIKKLSACRYDSKAPKNYLKSRDVTSTIRRHVEFEEFNPSENITGIEADLADRQAKQLRFSQMNDSDRFEAQQLRKLGVSEAGIQVPLGSDIQFTRDSRSETTDIVKADGKPNFLRGSFGDATSNSQSGVSFLRDSSGPLAKAARMQAQFQQDRRDSMDTKKRGDSTGHRKEWYDPKISDRELARQKNPIKEEQVEGLESDSRVTQSNWKEFMKKSTGSFGKKQTSASIQDQRRSLPIFQLRDAFLSAVRSNQILCVIGETGSGKTTQMTQYLVDDGYAKKGIVGCTQPRRVAAISIAKRVAEEVGCKLGEEVGYSIRFDDTTSPKTIIKYMTDGMLLREVLLDGNLTKYAVIILDEAHERTVSTDVLFGLCKEALKKRPDLKLIVTSATLDAEKFSSYFYNAALFTIPGRTYPVDIIHVKQPVDDYLEAALTAVMQIHLTEGPGDILVFLTGQDEIDMACQVLHDRMLKLSDLKPPPLIPLPVYSALPSEMQTAIFEPAPPGCRKCVIATNIAEASVTIDGIYFVVDPGFAKVKVYNPRSGMDSLIVSAISQASARQRAGRAGRTGPGKCYRLYTERSLEVEMLPSAVPEIQRSNLANVVLMLKAMGIDDVLGFDFMDKPQVQTLVDALEALWLLDALDDEGVLTKLGRRMAEFPMAPEESKMLLAAVDLGCVDDVITIVAMLSVQTIFYRPRDKQEQADERKRRFFSPLGDHITLLDVFRQWVRHGRSSHWCIENFIVERSLRRAEDVRKQLIGILDRFRLAINSSGSDHSKIRKAICAGYFRNACRRSREDEGFKIIRDDQQAFIHPSSVLYQKSPEYIIYHELVQTTREYLRDVCVIDPEWLPEVAPKLFTKADAGRLHKSKFAEKVRPLYNKFEDEAVWRLSKRYGRG